MYEYKFLTLIDCSNFEWPPWDRVVLLNVSFFELYGLVYVNGDVFADVYLSLQPILQTHCFWAENLQSHLSWRPFVIPFATHLSPFSTFVQKENENWWFSAPAFNAVLERYWGLISWFEVIRISEEMSQYCKRVGDGYHSKWTWVTDSVRGKEAWGVILVR